MKSALKHLAIVSSCLCLSGTGLPAQSGQNGLIGRRHVGAEASYLDFNGASVERARGFALLANLPVRPKYDMGFRYDYASVSGQSVGGTMRSFGGELLTHQPTPYGEAYFAGTLGYAWDSVNVAGGSDREKGGYWALRAGYEVPLAEPVAVNLSLGFTDAFSGRTIRNQRLEFRGEVNVAFSPRLTGVLSLTYQQIKRSPDGLLYAGGLRWMY